MIVTKRSTFILSVSRRDTVDAANESLISQATERRFPKKALHHSDACSRYFGVLLLLHHRKKEIEREIKENEVGTEYAFDLFFLFQIDQHHRKSLLNAK